MKKVKNLHIIAYVSIIALIISLTAVGWFHLPVLDFNFIKHGVGDLLKGRFVTAGGAQLAATILFLIGSALVLVGLIVFIVRSIKLNRKQYLGVGIAMLVISYVIVAYFYAIYMASIGYNGGSPINYAVKNAFAWLFNPNATAKLHLKGAGTIVLVVLAVTFIVCEIVAFVKTMKLVETPEVEEEDEIEVLTEDDMRDIIRDELNKFYSENTITVAPVAERVEEVVEEAPVEEPAVEEVVEETPVEEPVAEEVVAEEVVEEVVEEPAVEEVVEEVVEEPVVEEVVEEAPVEEPAVEEVVEEPVAEEVVEEVVEEPVVEEVVAEPVVEEEPVEVFERQEATVAVDANGNGRISFYERIISVDQELLDTYNEIKNEMMSYGVKSRISSTGDTFRLHRETYLKMIFSGKKVKLYMKLNPNDFKDSTIPYDDVSHKNSYKEIPFVFKVKSGLSLRRAKALIKQMMDEAGVAQVSEPKHVKYAENLIKDIKAGNVK